MQTLTEKKNLDSFGARVAKIGAEARAAKKRKDDPYAMRETPKLGKGTRFVGLDELFEKIASDEKLRDAIDLIEKIEGKPRLVTTAIVKQLKRDIAVENQIQAQKVMMDIQFSKNKREK